MRDATLPDSAEQLLHDALSAGGPLLLLTGAGISAESGIPTFRGPEGYWTLGSVNYRPEELATAEAFRRMPDEVWSWYLYRRGVCRAAQPNPAHLACVEIEGALGDGMRLVTQNVDGLHLRAGSSPERTYQIHGNIDFMRCAQPCGAGMWPIPEGVDTAWERGRPVGDGERTLLRCPRCGGPARPHVLFFDEFYDEEHFRADSALQAALSAELLLVVGTTGGTNVPVQIAMLMRQRDKPMIVVGPEPSRFSEMVERGGRGAFVRGTAGAVMPALARAIGYVG